jgi:hypothetical protein
MGLNILGVEVYLGYADSCFRSLGQYSDPLDSGIYIRAADTMVGMALATVDV